MPELPDIEIYREALRRRIGDRRLERVLIRSPFLLRTVEPAAEEAESRAVEDIIRLGKRLVIGFETGVYYVIHLMIAGRLRWIEAAERPGLPSKIELGRFRFDAGTLLITEASPQKRASLHVVRGQAALAEHNPGGIEPLECTPEELSAALRRENRTLKRALTDPRLLSGIGNAYSDEILHAAGLSPILLTRRLTEVQVARLHAAMRRVLVDWLGRLGREFLEPPPGRFPGAGEITAFRPQFAAHGKFGQPCPACGHKVQRIVRAESEINYCPTCQTGGRVLADRSLSTLLKDDWPERVEDWE